VERRSSQSENDARDRHVAKHDGTVTDFASEESSAAHDVEGRRRIRSLRPTEQRFERLEERTDDVVARLGKVEVAVSGFAGEMKIVPQLVTSMNEATAALRQHAHMKVTTTLEVDKAQQLADVEVGKAEGVTEAEVRKAKWALAAKIGAIIVGIWTVISTVLMASK
jgi:hypothetical protein